MEEKECLILNELVIKFNKATATTSKNNLFNQIELIIRKPVRRYIASHFKEINGNTIDDYYQTVLILLFTSLGEYDPTIGNYVNLMYRIVYRKMITEVRRLNCMKFFHPSSYGELPSGKEIIELVADDQLTPLSILSDKSEMQHLVTTLYAKLSDREKVIFIAFVNNNYKDYENTAKLAGIKSRGRIRRRKIVDNTLERIKRKARKILIDKGDKESRAEEK